MYLALLWHFHALHAGWQLLTASSAVTCRVIGFNAAVTQTRSNVQRTRFHERTIVAGIRLAMPLQQSCESRKGVCKITQENVKI